MHFKLSTLFLHESLTVLHIVVVINPIIERSVEQFLQLELVFVILAHVVVLSAGF